MVAFDKDTIIETVHGMRQLVPARRAQAANWSTQMWSKESREKQSGRPTLRSDSQEDESESSDG